MNIDDVTAEYVAVGYDIITAYETSAAELEFANPEMASVLRDAARLIWPAMTYRVSGDLDQGHGVTRWTMVDYPTEPVVAVHINNHGACVIEEPH